MNHTHTHIIQIKPNNKPLLCLIIQTKGENESGNLAKDRERASEDTGFMHDAICN